MVQLMDPTPWQHPPTLSYGSAAILGGKTNNTLQPPYLPDLAPCDFWLFRRLNIGFQHQRFATVEDIKCSVTAGYTPCHRMISTSASKHGKTIGASVCVQKGCTLRVIRLESTALQLWKFDGWILGTFWYFHILVRHSFVCGHMNVKSRIKRDIFCEYQHVSENLPYWYHNSKKSCVTHWKHDPTNQLNMVSVSVYHWANMEIARMCQLQLYVSLLSLIISIFFARFNILKCYSLTL